VDISKNKIPFLIPAVLLQVCGCQLPCKFAVVSYPSRAQALLNRELRAEEKRKAVQDELPKAQKMAKAVQDELPKAGMFDLYLASLKRAAKDKLWSSVLECAELLEKGKIFYIDMMISGFY
jgi:hypothetical protein